MSGLYPVNESGNGSGSANPISCSYVESEIGDDCASKGASNLPTSTSQTKSLQRATESANGGGVV